MSARPRRARALAALLLGLAVMCAAPAAASAAPVDVRGTWDLDCGGPCGPQRHTFVTEDFTTGAITGNGTTEPPSGTTWTESGTVTGSDIQFTATYDSSSYAVTVNGTVSPDLQTITGTASDGGALNNTPITMHKVGSAAPDPQAKKTANVEVKSGEASVKCPGQSETPLQGEEQIKLGCRVNTTAGVVGLTTQNEKGALQTADFYEGAFVPKQVTETQTVKGKKVKVLITELKLDVAKPTGCKTAKKGIGPASVVGGHLWGKGKGRFRTRGRRGAAAVRGTNWLTEERCGGTFFQVKEGVVTVTDFTLNKTVILKKGKSYLARNP
ncbi:MAG: hypothetical protein QOE06_1641 [Thermoleophilaceae bacterium]|nr:hypothetical protein [Thermoleophilaceae bacterium]